MTLGLFDRATPSSLARAGQVIECKVELKDLVRLAAAVDAELAALPAADRPAAWRHRPASIRLRFGFADLAGQVPAVSGDVQVSVDAVCQRCLECFELGLAAELSYLLLNPEEEAPDLPGYELWELGEASLRPVDLVDEALIMAWPLVAAHPAQRDCGPLAGTLAATTPDRTRPFADLKARLGKTDSK